MSNRTYLIQSGIIDAYAVAFDVPWRQAIYAFPALEAQIDEALPTRWVVTGREQGPLLRTCARAYALAAFSNDLEKYRKDVLI